jgi:hypothetical protein
MLSGRCKKIEELNGRRQLLACGVDFNLFGKNMDTVK